MRLTSSDMYFSQATEFLNDLKHYEGPRGRQPSPAKKFWTERPELIKALIETDIPQKAIYAFAKQNELPVPSESTFTGWVKDWRRAAQAEAQAVEAIPKGRYANAPDQSNGYVPSAEKVLATV